MSICVLAERYGVKGQTLRKQYKEKISDYRNWDQLEHAHDYLLYPENIGENLSLDETCLSNGDVYTILTNKAAKGRKGALVAMVRGVATDAVSGILRRLPHRKRLSVKTVTTDLSSAMMLTVRKVFPAAKLINDRFHVHLGVMQALLEHDIKPEIISGVSAGALAGVFYADGNEPHKVLDYFSGHKFQDLTKLVIPKKGLFDLCEFIDFLRTNVKAKNLEDLQLPLIITATDLDHGRMVHFHRGSIAERVAASCCMPVMFAPVNIDGTNYVDGGLMMNLPVSTLRRVCDKVVAVNVSPIMAEDYKMNIVSIAMRSFHFMFRANTFPEREKCDLLIEPYNLYGYSNTELEKAEEIFGQGYNTANEVLNQLLEEKGKIWK